jgi:hypothetical protein
MVMVLYNKEQEINDLSAERWYRIQELVQIS